MIATEGAPTQCQFGKVAGADDDGPQFVGEIHEYLRPFAGLTILVGDIANCGVEVDVVEMLGAGIADRNFLHGDTKPFHKGEGIVIGAAGSAEAWHGDTIDATAVVAETVEGADTG